MLLASVQSGGFPPWFGGETFRCGENVPAGKIVGMFQFVHVKKYLGHFCSLIDGLPFADKDEQRFQEK